MVKILKCKDVGADCDFVASGKTEEEVLKKAAEHARKDHSIKKVTKIIWSPGGNTSVLWVKTRNSL